MLAPGANTTPMNVGRLATKRFHGWNHLAHPSTTPSRVGTPACAYAACDASITAIDSTTPRIVTGHPTMPAARCTTVNTIHVTPNDHATRSAKLSVTNGAPYASA
ncbi:MAG: hypothetical protein HBSAPP03_17520 [Phycisphaerae bacterium]|nr:MAG: hypothetical protein HBSAPP03_17520 [Phycisphaerae bacterium]